MWTPDCTKTYKKSPFSRTSTRNFLISQGIIDQYNKILNLNSLRGAIQFIKSKTQFPIGDQKLLTEQGDKVVFNDKLFEEIDNEKTLQYTESPKIEVENVDIFNGDEALKEQEEKSQLTDYESLIILNPQSDITEEEFNNLTPEEKEILLFQEKNC